MIGTAIGPYTIVAKIGEGGMGEVYRARDARLNRDVAIKVLPDLFANDPERLARFTREAQSLALLNHTNIAQIHGLEENGGTRALVMELVEGEDLSQRIARGALPIDEALSIARQIADALEAAHEQAIIHRDLKPANIKVRHDGTVKVLDFGLAKALTGATGVTGATGASVTSPAMTQAGLVLGTAAYMSPEQAKGKTIDRRVDVWAFGCVLYEMLTASHAFPGEDITDTLVAVMSKEPDWSALPANTPATIHKLLRRCLEKDRRRRLDSVADARLEIEDAVIAPSAAASTPSVTPTPGSRLPWALAALLALTLVASLLIWVPWRPQSVAPETRLDIVTPTTDTPSLFALSPDGRRIVYVARSDGASRLWLRSLDSTTARPLTGTEGAGLPFWSPDSRSIGFYAANALKRLDVDGGAPQTLAPAALFRGGTWCADGSILYVPSATGPVMRVAATGGSPVAVPIADPRQQSNRWPQVLPDGRHFLFYATGPPDTGGIYLRSIDGGTPTRLTPAYTSGVFLPVGPGWLLWIRDGGALVAQRLDVANATLTGEPVTVADGVLAEEVFNHSAVSVSASGVMAYRSGAGKRRQLTWFDRSGATQGTWGEPNISMRNPTLSPDGTRVAVSRTEKGNEDVWVLDGARTTRLTFDGGFDSYPTWSPDGRHIVFRSNRSGPGDLYQKLASGAIAEEAIATSNETRTPLGWSSDGRFLLHFSSGAQFNYDLFATPMFGQDRTPIPLVNSPFREMWSAFSQDGRWLAYMSDQSGRNEIYVRPFRPPGVAGSLGAAVDTQWQISTAGGGFPVWRRDGKELYYLTTTGELMAAPIVVNGTNLQPGVPVRLFATRVAGGGVEVGMGRQYDVAPDGRFLINTELDDAIEPIRLILNWQPGGKDRR